MIYVIGPRDKAPGNGEYINTTSRSNHWTKGLSPFFLGPVDLYKDWVGCFQARNVENAWQFSKVYPQHVDEDGNPNHAYWTWAQNGWRSNYAHRYPMGKGAKPLYSYWNGKKLGYIDARKQIYCPVYAAAVEHTDAYKKLAELYAEKKELTLWDFDGYNHHALGMSYKDVLNCETRKMGHAFVLAMMLDNQRVWLEPEQETSSQ